MRTAVMIRQVRTMPIQDRIGHTICTVWNCVERDRSGAVVQEWVGWYRVGDP